MTEHQHTEWKESWRDEYLKWIAGFANAQGGVLVIGKNDAGKVVGVPAAKRLLVDLPNNVRDVLGIVVAVNLHTHQRRDVALDALDIEVEPYPHPHPVSYKGEYRLRSGSTKQELKGAALDRFLLARLGRHWNGVPVLHVAQSDLDSGAFKTFRQLSGIPIQISMYDDKLMIWNPGQLPADWSLDRLLAKHALQPANPDIANTLFLTGKIESWGRGIQLIRDACTAEGGPAPSFQCDRAGFWVKFPFSVVDELPETPVKTSVKVETPSKTPSEILRCLETEPTMTLREVAAMISKSLSAVARATAKLVKDGKLRHVGPQKSGHWEILK